METQKILIQFGYFKTLSMYQDYLQSSVVKDAKDANGLAS